jgi:predicted Zn-dependent peptidase
MPAEALRRIHRERYVGNNLVIAAAGNVQHGRFLEEVEGLFGGLSPGERSGPVPALPEPVRGDERVRRDGAQSHVVFGTEAPPHADPRRYAMVLLSSALGGGMSSRLFQRIREELALAYAVFSFQSFYALAGLAGVYVGTRPSWEERAVAAVREELARIARDGLSKEELEQTKRQVKGQIMLSLESTGARLSRLAGFALYDEPYLDLDELLGRIDAVTWDEVAAVAAEFYDPDRQLLLRLGPEEKSG